MPVPTIYKTTSSNCSKSTSTSTFTSTSTSTYTSTSHDNPPIIPSLYSLLDKLNIKTSNLDDNHLDVI